MLLVCYRTEAMICTISNNDVDELEECPGDKIYIQMSISLKKYKQSPQTANLETKNSLLFILLMSAISGSHFPVIKSRKKRLLV